MEPGPGGWTAICITLLGIFGSIIAKIMQGGKNMALEQEQNPEPRFEQKLDRIEREVSDLRTTVGILKGDQSRQATDVTDVRQKVENVQKEIASLREWLVTHVFGKRESE